VPDVRHDNTARRLYEAYRVSLVAGSAVPQQGGAHIVGIEWPASVRVTGASVTRARCIDYLTDLADWRRGLRFWIQQVIEGKGAARAEEKLARNGCSEDRGHLPVWRPRGSCAASCFSSHQQRKKDGKEHR